MLRLRGWMESFVLLAMVATIAIIFAGYGRPPVLETPAHADSPDHAGCYCTQFKR